jgi:hypothetical protein
MLLVDKIVETETELRTMVRYRTQTLWTSVSYSPTTHPSLMVCWWLLVYSG